MDSTDKINGVSLVLPSYAVSRKVLLQGHVNELSGFKERDRSLKSHLKILYENFSCHSFIFNVIPILEWLPKYSLKNNSLCDIIAGITVAVMHIPQGLAYGIMAGVTPSVGLYMAFYPVLTYLIFGTSKHISVGTLSIVSIMTLKLVHKYSDPLGNEKESNSSDITFTSTQVVSAAAMVCGIYHIIMCVFQLGNLFSILSEPLISAFTTGAAIQIFVSQLGDIFGIKIARRPGAFQLIYALWDFFSDLPKFNSTAIIISAAIIVIMIVTLNIQPMVRKLCPFRIPIELIVVLGSCIASKLIRFGPNYNVVLIGEIPMGLPAPEMPSVRLLWLVSVDSIIIAIVSYTITISMGRVLAKDEDYEVRPNQELFALGCSNLIGGIFSCFPNSASLARSIMQHHVGGKTQITSVVSALLILIVLLWLGPYFEDLPKCALSSIIVVALKKLYLQVFDLKRYYKEGRLEFTTWILTFVAVIVIDVEIGLILGICVSLSGLYFKGWNSASAVLGNLAGTDIYVDLATHMRASELQNIKIFRYIGVINFGFSSAFKKSLYKLANINPLKIHVSAETNGIGDKQNTTRMLIIDLSCVPNADTTGIKMLQEIQIEMERRKIQMILTCPNDRVFDAINYATLLNSGTFLIMPTIHDAVTYAKCSL